MRDKALMSHVRVYGPSEPCIAFIGAGVTGIMTAYNLLRRRCRVTVFDRRSYATMETYFANCGQLSAFNAKAWLSPAIK